MVSTATELSNKTESTVPQLENTLVQSRAESAIPLLYSWQLTEILLLQSTAK